LIPIPRQTGEFCFGAYGEIKIGIYSGRRNEMFEVAQQGRKRGLEVALHLFV